MFASLTQLSPPNELAISPFIHLASKNWPMCMRSKNKECFKKTTHSHYSLTLPPMNHCLIMPIVWAFRHGFLRLRRSTSNLLPIKFSCMTVLIHLAKSSESSEEEIVNFANRVTFVPSPTKAIMELTVDVLDFNIIKLIMTTHPTHE